MSTIITHRQFPTTTSIPWTWRAAPDPGGRKAGGAGQRRRHGHLWRRDQRAVLRHRRRPSPGRHRLLPLSVDFEEKLYAVGRIPGSFQPPGGPAPARRAFLTSRVIDRPIRPLFPTTSATTCPLCAPS